MQPRMPVPHGAGHGGSGRGGSPAASHGAAGPPRRPRGCPCPAREEEEEEGEGGAALPAAAGTRGAGAAGKAREGTGGTGRHGKAREGTGRDAGSRRRRAGHCPRRASCGRADSEPAAPRPPSPALPTPLRAVRASLPVKRLDFTVCPLILAWQWWQDCHRFTHTPRPHLPACVSPETGARCSPSLTPCPRSPASLRSLLQTPRLPCQSPPRLLQPRSCPHASAHGCLREPHPQLGPAPGTISGGGISVGKQH